jgi:hypothetical protein
MKSPSKRSGTANRFELITEYGTVRVYTRRHINDCKFTTPDHNHCTCPKWIYSKPRGGKAIQKSAGTPSFAEACATAQKMSRGFDPEISQARAITAPVPGISLEAALARYYAALRARKVDPAYLTGSITPVFDHRPPRPNNRGRRAVNLALRDYLDSVTRSALDPVTRVEQITGRLLDDWASAWGTNDLTSKLWRTVATSFFRWAAGRDYGLHSSLITRMNAKLPLFGEKIRVKTGNRCGYFAPEQMQTIYAALPFYRSQTRWLPAHYAERLRAMIDLGRWGGMAIADIVCFSPRVNLTANNVLTYRRHKNRHKKDQIAVVLLDPAVAARLRAIPAEHGSLPDQPLRFAGRSEDRARGIWRDRFQDLCNFAGITEIETEVGTVRRAHPHMLRDTFAIDAILRGVSLENVAKMLGHATIEMTQKAYLFWIAQRVDHCIEDQRLALARVPLTLPVEERPVATPSRTLIH